MEIDLLSALRRAGGSANGIHFLGVHGDEGFVAYGELADRAARLLAALREAGVRQGDAAILAARRNEDLLTSFWACVLGRIVAVPLLYPANDDHRRRIENVAARLGDPWLVTDAALAPLLPRGLDAEALPRDLAPAPAAEGSASDLCHLQFSSGSTGTPKGVRITHANVLHNVDAITRRGGFGGDDVFLSWMPLTHDFGLIWFHLMPLILGAKQCLMPTQAFVRDPNGWMTAVTRHRATITGAPSSAYRRLIESYRPAVAERWDLGSLRFLGNGAEPISPRVVRDTHALLERHGLAPGTMTMGYGLAEATLIVSFTQAGEGLRTIRHEERELVDVGAPIDHVEVRIAGDDGRALPEHAVGRILVRGASVTGGYQNDAEATSAAIDAEGWLDTGDLGLLDGGRLVCTGRVKELIILEGANYYPHDIEEAASDGDARVVACAVPRRGGDGEELALFVQFRGEIEAFLPVARRVRTALARRMGLAAGPCLPVRRIPHTTSGKVQRVALAQAYAAGEYDAVLVQVEAAAAAQVRALRGERRKARALVLAEAREISGAEIVADRPLFDQGFTSMRLVELLARLNQAFGTEHPPSFVFEHPTTDDLARAFAGDELPPPAAAPRAPSREPIAIVGMACRFPGAPSAPRFWELLAGGGDAVREVPADRWPAAELWSGAFLDDVDNFDARFFGIAPVEARSVDPQQFLLLETSWEAIEDAGIDAHSLKGARGGVFAGICNGDYARVEARSGRLDEIGPYAFTGSAASVAAGRIAYVYGMNGPALSVDTACSSSLAAVHLAVRSLHDGESDVALAGGVNLILEPDVHVGLSRMQALSPDGRCKPFDQSADGYGRGEGCAVVVLKRLSDAQRDGDRVLAVIRGSALNHDGASNGLTVPSGAAQQAVVRDALAAAALRPDEIDYVEAHGTGTPLGDPIEIEALARVHEGRVEPLLVGSVKSNIAHTEAAAGMAGLIKCVLSMRAETIPATIGVHEPNRAVDWPSLPLRIASQQLPWPQRNGTPRRAGISSFGLSGTNAHVILEEPLSPRAGRGWREAPGEGRHSSLILPLSARSEPSLRALAAEYAQRLERGDDARMLCAATARRRTPLPLRIAVAGTAADLAQALKSAGVARSSADAGVVFVYSGQGSLDAASVCRLYAEEPVFRAALDRCGLGIDRFDDAALAETINAQPAIVAVEIALTELWRSRGIVPCAVLGHSIGEYAAAVAAGIMSAEDALQLAAVRGRAMQALPRGCMLAVSASAERAATLLVPGAEIAAINAPERVTVSGTNDAVAAVAATCEREGIRATALAVSHAFHSAMMKPAVEVVRAAAAAIHYAPPSVPFVSTVTGAAIDAVDAEYWARHVRQPVLFDAAIRALASEHLFLEIGGSAALCAAGAQVLPDAVWLPTLRASRPLQTAESTAALWREGAAVDWSAIYDDRAWDVDLPSYAWDRQACRRKSVATSASLPASGETVAEGRVRGAPAESVLDALRAILQKIAGVDGASIGEDDNLVRLGLDSLMLVRVRQSIERRFGVAFEVRDFYERLDTLAKIAEAIGDSGAAPKKAAPKAEVKGLYKQLDTEEHAERPPQQRAHLARLIANYTAKTRGSKGETARHRAHLANSRSVIGFRRDWKEMIYPLQVARAEGANVWDVDGNEYVDVTMGFGALLFGHAPDFVRDALRAEVDAGMALGPTRPVVGDVAERIARMTGAERVAFFTTGTEAVMVGARVARAVTQRDKIVLFTNSYHGSFDGFLATGWADDEGATTLPIAPGTPAGLVGDVVVLEYGSAKSLDYIRKHAGELAAVLVEPVQSRNPIVQPRDFLHELREITRRSGTALLFDEMITGFRCHIGGAQAWFGVRADLMTYGKVVGGGMPIGVLAGSHRFMDAVDGGHWSYGNDTVPENYTAFVAGTYNGHALSMAAAGAVLRRLEAEGPALQERLNARTAAFCAELNAFFEAADVPIRAAHFASLFRFVMSGDAELLNYHLLDNGVFVWEGRNCFLSAAHSDADVARVVAAVKRGVEAMLDDGWLPSARPRPAPPRRIPLSKSQAEMWFLLASEPASAAAYREMLALELRDVDAAAMQRALDAVVARHAALRTIAIDERGQTIAPSLAVPLEVIDAEAPAALASLLSKPFDLGRGPLLRAALVREPGKATLAVVAHHLIADGWSLGVIAQELLELYRGRAVPPARDFAEYVVWESARALVPPEGAPLLDEPYPPLELSANRGSRGYDGARIHVAAAAELTAAVHRFSREHGLTDVTTYFSAFAALLSRLGGQSKLVIGVPYAGQLEMEAERLVGNCSTLLPVPVVVDGAEPYAAYVERVRAALLAAFEKSGRLFAAAAGLEEVAAIPRINVIFNMDRPVTLDLDVHLPAIPIEQAKFDLFLNIQELNGRTYFDVDFRRAALDEGTVRRWVDAFFALLLRAIDDPKATVASVIPSVARDPLHEGDPSPSSRLRMTPYVPPRDATEEALCRIWSAGLGVPRVGIADRFDDLGGHSLKAIRIAARIERELGIRYRLRDLFEHPTVAELASIAPLRRRAFAPIPPLPPAARYDVSNAQLRLWMLDALEPGLTAYNIPFALVLRDGVDVDALRAAARKLAARHEILRTRIVEDGGVPYQVIDDDPPDVVEVSGDDPAALAARPFDLARGPLWRIHVVERDGVAWLVCNVHHVIADVWSLGIFVRELMTFYRYGDAPLPPLPLQYKDFAAWQRQAQDPGDAAYWTNVLAEPRAAVTYPPDRPRPSSKTYRGASVKFTLPAAAVQRLCRERGVSLFTLMAAAMTAQLHALTGERDVILGSVIAGRDHPDAEGLIGFFVNNLALRDEVRGDEPFAALLARVRETVLGALEHSALPWDDVVDRLRVPRDPSRNAVFDVVLVMDDRGEAAELSALAGGEIVEIDTPTSQFDLTLYVSDGDDAIRCNAVFNTDLYDESTIARHMAALATLIERAAADPMRRVRELNAPAEREASYHQERLWFVDRFENGYLYPAQPVYYNVPLLLRGAATEPARLQRAVDRVAAKYEALRMRIVDDGARAAVRIAEAAPRVSVAAGTLAQEVERPFDLAADVLWRVAVAGDDVLLVAHHAIVDIESLRRVGDDLLRALRGEDIGAEALPFSEVARRQRAGREAAIAADMPYWRGELANLTALELPTDRPRAAIHVYRAASERFALPPHVTAALGGGEAAYLALFQALLHRYSDQGDIVTGVVDRLPDDAVGPLSEYVVIRGAYDDATTFRAAAGRIAAKLAAARQHHAIAFDELVLQLAPKNDMSRTALFDVLFRFGAEEDMNRGWGKFDLNLAMRPDGGVLTYNAELFDSDAIARMLRHFAHLAGRAAEAPDAPLASLELSDEAPAPQPLADYPRHATLHALFERRAAETPDAVAMTMGGASITYRGVERRANALAQRLRAHGVGPDALVGVCLDRSFDLVIAFLAVLKAGGAYVPLDPEYPPRHLEFIMRDAALRWVVTDPARAAALPATGAGQLLVDDAWSDTPPPPLAAPHNLCYVIYTSGSTGKPKGVLIEHRNVVALLFHDGALFDFGARDVWTLFHSPSFDFSVWEMYGALLFGGRLVIVPRDVARDPAAFRRLLAEERVTVLNQTPAAFYALIAEDDEHPRAALALRTVIFGGEKLMPSKLQGWHARYPGCRLINMYGITETTVHVTFKELGEDDLASSRSVIGAPLPNVAVYIVDRHGRLQPPGVPGEILVGGHGVGRGYLDRPELTAQRFLDNPFGEGRLYRSGDLGRRLPGGGMVYHGRIDHQVKVRGFRIELGEIEAQLLAHDAVQHAVVVASDDGGGSAQLHAFLVASRGLTLEELQRFLGDRLPEHMVPSRFFRIDAVPMTENGKVDRAALRGEELTGAAGFVAPRTGIEASLARIWAEVLRRDRVSLADNFFDLGGHSLKATQAVSRIRQRLGRDVTLKDFFAAPSLAALAAAAASRPRLDGASIPTAPPAADYPLSFAQRRLWTVQQINPSSVAYNMVGQFRLDGALDADALERAFRELIARHEILRTTFRSIGGEPRQVIAGHVDFHFDRAGLTASVDPGAELARRVDAELHHVFDLARGPLFRAALLHLPGGAHALVVNLHHIVCDGWSVAVLMNELAALVGGAALPPLPIQYKDFAVWQRGQMEGEAAARHREAWLARFADGVPQLDLPQDRARPAAPSGRGAMVAEILDAPLSDALRALAREQQTTLFAVLASALALLLARRSGRRDLVIGTPVAGRNHIDLEGQVGFYLNLLPLRIRIDGNASVRALVRDAAGIAAAGQDHQDYPFDLLAEQLGAGRDAARHPLFDVLLILQNNEPMRKEMGGVRIEELPEQSASSKTDLNFMIEDRPRLELKLEYAADLFDGATAASLAADFVRVAAAMAERPDAPVNDVLAALHGGAAAEERSAFLAATMELGTAGSEGW
jgi:amino acid adenylation domain-containing protein